MTLESKFYPGQQVYLPVMVLEIKFLEHGQTLYKIKCCVNDWEGEVYENKI